MDTINKIMAAVGFTEYSEGLLKYATRIVEGLNAELIVASIINVRDVEAISPRGPHIMGRSVTGRPLAVFRSGRLEEYHEPH